MISNKKLFLQELRRITWAIVVLFLVMIFMKPVMLLVAFENNARWSFGISLIQMMEREIVDLYGADMVVTYASAILLGLVGFSFVFSKSKVDMYHSIPVSRKRRFIINYAVGLSSFIVLYSAATIFNMLVAAANHFLTIEAIKNIIMVYAGTIVHFIYSYSLTIVAVMLTGNIVVCFAAIGVLELYYVLITTMIAAYMNRFFVTKTSYHEIGSDFWHKLPYISPFTSAIQYYEKLTSVYNNYFTVTPPESRLHMIGYLCITLIFAILVILAAYFLYEKRASEAAGKSIAFKISQPFIRIPVVIIVGLFAGFMMLSFTGAYESKWLWIGAVAGAILTHCAMEMIFNLNFKAFMKNKIQLAACIVVTVFIILIFDKDLVGYDTYIPDRDKIVAATVSFDSVDNNMNYNEFTKAGDNTWTTTYMGRNDWIFERPFTDDNMIDDIYALSELGVSCVDEMKADRIKNHYAVSRYMDSSYNLLNSYEKAAADEVIIGEVDGPTSTFIAGKLGDEDSSETLSGVFSSEDGPASYFVKGREAKLNLAKQYMRDENIVINDYGDDDGRFGYMTVYYKLKNNKVILRNYSIKSSKLEGPFNKVYSHPEFKKTQFNLFEMTEREECPIYKVEVCDTLNDKQMVLDYDAAKEFLDIYKSELVTLTVDDLKQTPVGQVVPLIKNEHYDEQLSGYFIYPRFKKTLNFMKSLGVNMEFFTTDVDPKALSDISVYTYDFFQYQIENEENPDGQTPYYYETINMDMLTYLPDDPDSMAVIEAMAPYLKIMTYGYSNSLFVKYDNRYDINVSYMPGAGMQKGQNCKIVVGEMPKELLEDLMIKLFEQLTREEDPTVQGYPVFHEFDPGERGYTMHDEPVDEEMSVN